MTHTESEIDLFFSVYKTQPPAHYLTYLPLHYLQQIASETLLDRSDWETNMCIGPEGNWGKSYLRIAVEHENRFACNYHTNLSATKNEEMRTYRKSIRKFKIGIIRK